jgi:hypothetical protein
MLTLWKRFLRWIKRWIKIHVLRYTEVEIYVQDIHLATVLSRNPDVTVMPFVAYLDGKRVEVEECT